MVFDVTVIIVLGCYRLCLYMIANLNVVCSDCSTDRLSCTPIFLPRLRPPYFLRHSNIEIGSVNNPIIASKCSSEGKNHTLKQKLEMFKLSEEDMSKAHRG